jgi:hypothetical protein
MFVKWIAWPFAFSVLYSPAASFSTGTAVDTWMLARDAL